MSSAALEKSDVTDFRLGKIESTLATLVEAVGTLATIEQKHLETREALERAFAALEKQGERVYALEMERHASLARSDHILHLERTTVEHDKRLLALELEMPTLKLVRGWIIAGVLSMMGLLGVALFKLLMHT